MGVPAIVPKQREKANQSPRLQLLQLSPLVHEAGEGVGHAEDVPLVPAKQEAPVVGDAAEEQAQPKSCLSTKFLA